MKLLTTTNNVSRGSNGCHVKIGCWLWTKISVRLYKKNKSIYV